jgi:hypothetical protein
VGIEIGVPKVPMKVEVLTGPQGGGKSSQMREEALAAPGLYLFTAPTIELIEEQADEFRRAARWMTVLPVHSESGGRGTVKDRLAYAHAHISENGLKHAVVLTTHETMMSVDLDPFTGWHARIDEAPAAVQAGQFDVRTLRPWFDNTFDVRGAPGSDWSAIALKGAPANWKAIERSPVNGLSEFQKQAAQTDRVFVRATDWHQHDVIDWFSMWTPLALSHFASVQIAGSAYTDSVGYRAAIKLFGDRLDFRTREVKRPRTGQPSVEVHYFTRAHRGSTSFWTTSEGRLAIKHVCDHLTKALAKTGYWSANTVVQHLMEHRLKAKLIPPTAAGLNKHRSARSCAFIFSAKARQDDTALMTVFDLSPGDIRKAREDDAIAQFVMRGAIRNEDYAGPFAIYLYEEKQAERLRDHLTHMGFTNVTISPVDTDALDAVRKQVGGPTPTADQQAVAKAARNSKAATRMKEKRRRDAEAAGRVPGTIGRPSRRRVAKDG